MGDLVSVIIPAYNVGQYLRQTIGSVQAQSGPRWELVVVDDGSTDDTPQILREMADGDPRIRVLRQDNAGSAAARNTGLDHARGKYVTFLDGDDFWTPDFLSSLLEALRRSGKRLAYCGYRHIYGNGYSRRYRYGYPGGRIVVPYLRGKVQIHIGAIMVETEVFRRHDIRFTPGCLIGQDQEVVMRLLAVEEAAPLPRELLYYRVRAGSAITSSWKWEKHLHAILSFRRGAQFILHHASEEERGALQREIEGRLAQKQYKFLWRMVKRGAVAEAARLLREDFVEMERLEKGRLGLVDRVKYFLLMRRIGDAPR
ncbi:MAG TPA: glycosyltransferase family 2 protein [Verrucomicrobiae bacterium]|nr:glycosyltransferase family 2 protein [Verrucomicrobiae bacterium]